MTTRRELQFPTTHPLAAGMWISAAGALAVFAFGFADAYALRVLTLTGTYAIMAIAISLCSGI